MHTFTIIKNQYLRQNIQAFYHADYLGYQRLGNPDYINAFKNTFNDTANVILNNAVQKLETILPTDLPQIQKIIGINPITVCVVPRAKAEANYQPNQLLFKSTIRDVIKNQQNDFYDGIDYITRHTNTRTTHLPVNTPNYNNDGVIPYPGITISTCNILDDVRGKHILLIDDLYTKTINVDEDVIQALLDKGASSVTFYAIGRTVHN